MARTREVLSFRGRARRLVVGTALVASLCLSPSAISQVAGAPVGGPETIVVANVKAGTNADRYLDDLLTDLAKLDANGDGAGPDDVDRARAEHERRLAERSLRAPEERARRETRLRQQVANLDLDANGRLSKEEWLTALTRDGVDREAAAAVFARQDQDSDGQLSLDELSGPVSEAPAARPFALPPAKTSALERLFDIDPDRDGRLTAAELTAVVRRQIARIDIDGDGEISEPEYTEAQSLIHAARAWARTPKCPAVPAAPDAEIIAFHSSGGAALSSIEIGQSGNATEVVNVFIDPRDEPLYLVLSSFEPVIWRFSGHTDRIQHVLITAKINNPDGQVAAGATGLDGDKLSFVRHDCVMPRRSSAPTHPIYLHDFRETIAAATGLLAKPASAPGSAGALKIYPGKIEIVPGSLPPAPPGFDAKVWAEGLGYWPNGISAIEQAEVITPTTRRVYDLLPSHMGMAQLVAQGIARETGNFHEYLIEKPIARFPPALYGAASASFVLAEGVPMPDGEQGHGCVFDGRGTAIGENDRCTRHPRDEVRTFAQLKAEGRVIELSETGTGDHEPIRPVEPRELDIDLIPNL